MSKRDVLALPAPSTRAKSTSARDLRYGRSGGRWLPVQSEAEQAEAFRQALESGEMVRARCACTAWFLRPCHLNQLCRACDQPMTADGPRWIVLDDAPVIPEELPAGPTGEWETFRRAIGPCSVCGEPCRSFDPEGRMRHWCCEVPA